MFGIFNKVFGLNPEKIGNSLKQSLLGDYADDIGEFFQDVKADAGVQLTSWGKTLGLVEDPKSDWDLLAEQAQDRMQPIVEKYYDGDSWDGDYDEEEIKEEMKEAHAEELDELEDFIGEFSGEPAEPPAIEMMDLNPGESAVTNSLTELLYDLEETEGKIGTETYSLQTEEGLQNMLEVLKDEQWNSQMELTEVDEGLLSRLREQRLAERLDNAESPLEIRQIQLEEIIPENSQLSLNQEMAGTGISPLDLDL